MNIELLTKVVTDLHEQVVGSMAVGQPSSVKEAVVKDYRWQQATAAELRFYTLVNYGELVEFTQAIQQHGMEPYNWPVEAQVCYIGLALACGLATQYPALEQLER